ncbi:hypothetical protein [Paraglaciecola chathamensis]|uniref:Uncharacterized protein n=1 Tax=Paraglaciecola chathamensis TaxID=368405 RepID=A0A8H9IC12_9ALTE|nr:hypothetical protein [Paraglaciecola oceanifecundans]GGZ73285.1 hypothetical protein GCM10011274_34710 [Paraglaciecola oceanifecundans]
MDLLAQEYFKLIDVISGFDGYLMTVKGWSITVGLALIGYAFQQKQKSILLLCCASALCFSFVDAKFKEYQVSYYPRMQQIENCFVKEPSENCSPLKVDGSWSETKKWYGVFLQYGKLGVIMPHFILFVLALFLYLKPQYFVPAQQLTSQARGTPKSGAPS